MEDDPLGLDRIPDPGRAPGEPILHVVLYRPEIAANVGAIGRTCVAVGAKLRLIRPLGFHLDDRKLKRAGMDYWEKLNWDARDDFEELLAEWSSAGTDAWYFSTKGTRPYTRGELPPRGRACLRFGRAWTSRPHPPARSQSRGKDPHAARGQIPQPRERRLGGSLRSAPSNQLLERRIAEDWFDPALNKAASKDQSPPRPAKNERILNSRVSEPAQIHGDDAQALLESELLHLLGGRGQRCAPMR